jgi:acetyl/propionyl-CoA carboxylase alpha subunit
MARALGEYDVRGIKTTIPFFCWLLAEPDFQAGRFDTTFIDQVLASRQGRPFLEVPGESEDAAAVAAAVHAFTRKAAAPAPSRDAGSLWKRSARLDGLR